MLYKLQKNTLVKSQVIGYALTLCIGVCILLTVCQLYFDVKPLLQHQTDVFASKYAVVSKNISIFKTLDKEGIYFDKNEMEKLKQEPFVKSVSHFTPASFKIGASTPTSFLKASPINTSMFNPMIGNGLKAVGLCLLSSPKAI